MVGGWLVGFEASLKGTNPCSNLGISIKIQKGWATTPQHEIIQCVFEGHRNYSIRLRFHHGGHRHFFWGRWGEITRPLLSPFTSLQKSENRFTYVFHPGGSFRTAWNLSMALCVLYDPWQGRQPLQSWHGAPYNIYSWVISRRSVESFHHPTCNWFFARPTLQL